MELSVFHKECLLKTTLSIAILSCILLTGSDMTPAENKTERCGNTSMEINEDILKGIHLLYDRRFVASEKLFNKVVADYPDRPGGYFYLAMVTWSRLAAGFWYPSNVTEYKNRIDRTVKVAEARIKNGKPDSYDYFYLGGALGFDGRFELMRGNWLTSFFLARDAIDALNKCFELNPGNKDVLLGIGTFDYYTARLSGVLKFLSYMLIHKGDTEEGLRKLREASEKAVYSATEAKSMLLHIYLFVEEDFKKSLQLAEELAKKYDKNPRFKVLLGVSQVRLGLEKDFSDTLSELRKRSVASDYSPDALMWKRQALYLSASHCLYKGHYSEARSQLKMILEQPDEKNDPSMIAWPLVKIGMSLDLENNREKAMDYYNRVIGMENGAGAQFLSEKLLKKPPKVDDPFLGY